MVSEFPRPNYIKAIILLQCNLFPLNFSPTKHLTSSPVIVYLVVIQKRSSLLVCWNNRLISANTEFLAENTWNGDQDGEHKEGSHDSKGKDPLESDDLGEELADTKRSC